MLKSSKANHILTVSGEADYVEVMVQGTPMLKKVAYEGGHMVRSAFFRMEAGSVVRQHGHRKWVQVMVIEGTMHVDQRGGDSFDAGPGSVYFVEPASPHIETALTSTLLLVTQGEDRPEWIEKQSAADVTP